MLYGMVSGVQAADGKVLFQRHCAVCHGETGDGGIGLPLSKPAVIHSLTDEYIGKTIRAGRPGRIMPAFDQLSEEEVNAIVGYIRTWGESRVAVSDTPAKGDVVRGRPLFEQHCAACHGQDLSGSKEGMGVTFSRKRDMPIMPPALNNAGFLQAASDGMLRYIIHHGRERTPMPAFDGKLDSAQMDDIIAYVRGSEDVHPVVQETGTEPLTLTYESSSGFDETVESLRAAIRSNNFRVFPDRYLEEGLTDEFSVNKKQVSLRFCNFNKLFEALKLEPRLGVILPCTVTVVEGEDGKVRIIAANVEALAKLFNNDKLSEAFATIKASYDTILDEVTL
jgi:cytochrome c oxidase cbb3-type subunit 3